MPRVTVALPIHVAGARFARAFDAIARQTVSDLELLIVLNGADDRTRAIITDAARRDARARIVETPEANLAAALNVALESAKSPLLVRMDADDWCRPDRIETQLAWLTRHPSAVGVGCAWEIVDADDRVITTVRPPTDPRAMRWRLLIGNCLAHGSMVLRREAILAAGGYDSRIARGQDYELWLRLTRAGADLGAVEDVLYRYTTRHEDAPTGSSDDQARTVAPLLIRAWGDLSHAHDPDSLIAAVHDVLTQKADPASAASRIESVLTSDGPSAEALIAWLWTRVNAPAGPRRAYDVSRCARLREVGALLRNHGVRGVYLWGAGEHSRWILRHAEHLGVTIVGLIDDNLAGIPRHDLPVVSPDALTPGQTAIISSDWHEDALWASSAQARARGVNIIRLYG